MVDNKTISSSVRWALEIYPWAGPPNLQGADDTHALADVMIAASDNLTAQNIANDVSKVVNSYNKSKDKEAPEIKARFTSLGIIAISINRSKSTPAATADVRVVGRLPPEIIVGNWCIISSTQYGHSGSSTGKKNMVKFLGQIDNLAIAYSSDAKGTIRQTTNIRIREWSHILLQEVTYDIGSIFAQIRKNTNSGNFGETSAALARKEMSVKAAEELQKIAQDSYDPFSAAHLALKVLGLISRIDEFEATKEVTTGAFRNVVARPTEIPSSIVLRVGSSFTTQQLNENKSAAQNNSSEGPIDASAWDTGFIRVVSGNKYPPFLSAGSWEGYFSKGLNPGDAGPANPNPSINDLIAYTKNSWETRKDKVVIPNSLTAINTAVSAWSLISLYLEPDLYEVYTDMLHQEGASSETPSSIPVIFIRAKPYALKYYIENSQGYAFETTTGNAGSGVNIKERIKEDWTTYDNIPTIEINSASIMSFSIQNEFQTSPNYIRTYIGGDNGISQDTKNIVSAQNRTLLTAQRDRFGGQSYQGNITFNIIEQEESEQSGGPGQSGQSGSGVSNIVEYSRIAMELWRLWFGYIYEMPNATLTIKDDNYPLTVGFNIKFRVGNFDLVGHVESYSVQASIDGRGVETTNISIALSRIVADYTNLGGVGLAPLPPSAFGNLF